MTRQNQDLGVKSRERTVCSSSLERTPEIPFQRSAGRTKLSGQCLTLQGKIEGQIDTHRFLNAPRCQNPA